MVDWLVLLKAFLIWSLETEIEHKDDGDLMGG